MTASLSTSFRTPAQNGLFVPVKARISSCPQASMCWSSASKSFSGIRPASALSPPPSLSPFIVTADQSFIVIRHGGSISESQKILRFLDFFFSSFFLRFFFSSKTSFPVISKHEESGEKSFQAHRGIQHVLDTLSHQKRLEECLIRSPSQWSRNKEQGC